jgi:hypothetical protein
MKRDQNGSFEIPYLLHVFGVSATKNYKNMPISSLYLSVCPSMHLLAQCNSRTAERIFINFHMGDFHKYLSI